MTHGRAGAARFTGTRAIASPRFVGALARGRVHGRIWVRDETVQPETRSTYRLLVSRGLAPDEAATLTAFLCGIPVADGRWSIRQVNQLLFLKAMVQNGRFGPSDGGTARPH